MISKPNLAFLISLIFLSVGQISHAGTGDSTRTPMVNASGAMTSECDDSNRGQGPDRWRHRASVTGPVALYGPLRDFSRLGRENPGLLFRAKIPAIVLGDHTVTLTIPDRIRHRASLSYAGRKEEKGYAQVTFRSCAFKQRTGWAGGFRLRNRKPIQLRVQVEGSDRVRHLRIGERG